MRPLSLLLLSLLPALSHPQSPARYNPASPAASLVNPFIGTGGHGHTFPGACVPNGLVQLSPDTRPDGYMDWDGCGGYHYSDSLIYGFSHTHLSGTGVADLCDVLLMPMSGNGSTKPVEYRSRFSHASENAHAGYYRVHLDDPNVDVELTATQRTGVHRYQFAKDADQWVVLDLSHRDALTDHNINVEGRTAISGYRRSSSWAKDQRLFFVIEFSKPFVQHELEPYMSARGDNVTHHPTKAALRFQPSPEPLIVKVGISAVSIEGARRNLEAEVPHWDFDLVRKQAEVAWNDKLNKIQVKGGTNEQQRAFYTALYHSYVAPYIFNDVNGQYRGMDGEVHTADHNVYTVYSLWDTFRALHPLMTILEPEMTRDWIKTFLLHYQQGGRLPVWELWGNETDCMIGYHSVSVIADAYAKGIRDFDTKLALEAMVASAEDDHFGLKAYRERGYISSEDEPESVSRTLEYAYDDWCIARYAEMNGEQEVAQRFYTRSRNWQNLFDPDTRFFRARRNGGFIEPFDPYEVNFHFTEANAWQYGLFVPHDMERYMALVGGTGGLRQRLDALFTAGQRTTGRDQSDITGLIGQYAHGNEPSHHFAYLYTLSDGPRGTDQQVGRIMKEFYTDAPDGLIGNEDCGQMSAWFVMSALGFYPINPGEPRYTLGIPLFDRATIDLGQGRTFTVTADVLANDRSHVEQVTWNGNEPTVFRSLSHAELMKGGKLHFQLGPRPGGAPSDPEMPETWEAWTPVPIIQANARSFTDSLLITLRSSDPRATLHYRIDEGRQVAYSAPFWIRSSCSITAVAQLTRPGEMEIHYLSTPVTGRFNKYVGGRTITLESTYANQYAAGGDQALVDGLRGGKDFRTGEWQGYEGQDVLATVDLGSVQQMRRLGLSVLQDQRAWIWYPSEVTFAWSMNGRQWSSRTVETNVDRKADGGMTAELWTEILNKKARYIKIMVKNAGPCPDWHPGKGGTTWIFMDEVLIETESQPAMR